MKLKRLSLFLALVMILSAFAGTFTITISADDAKPWQVVGGEAYATLKEAVAGLGSNTTIKLTADYTRPAASGVDSVAGIADNDETLDVVESLVIDLDGHTWTLPSGAAGRYINPSSGNVTIQNGIMVSHATAGVIQLNQTDGGQVFLKNLEITTTGAERAFVLNKDGQTLTLENCTVHSSGKSSADWLKATFLCHTASTLNIIDSTLINENEGYSLILLRNAVANTLNIQGSTLISQGFTSTNVNLGTLIKIDTTGNGSNVINISDSVVDVSKVGKQRAFYFANGATPKISMYNSAFFGSADTNDIAQIGVTGTTADYLSSGNFTVGENVVFVGGGAYTSANGNIFRIRGGQGTGDDDNTAAYSYDDATDPYNNIQVRNFTPTNEIDTVDALLAHYGIIKAPLNGTNYDEFAKSMGYVVRVGTAEEAYAGGKMTGYFFDLNYAIKNNTSLKNMTLVNDFTIADTFTFNKAVTFDGNGYKVIATGKRAFYITEDVTLKNLTIHGPATANTIQMEGTAPDKTLTLQDVNITGVTTGRVIYMIGDGQTVVLKGNISSTATSNHTFIDMYNSNQTVTFEDANVQLANYSRVVFVESVEHSSFKDGDMENLTVNFTRSKVSTNAWRALVQFQGKDFTMSIDDSEITLVDERYAVAEIPANQGYTLNNKQVAASDAVQYVMYTSSLLNGASVRIAKGANAENLTESGIRFESTLSAAVIASAEALVANGAIQSYKYGTVIFKKTDLGNKTVAELVVAANADANDDLIVADIEAQNGIVENGDGSKTIRAAIINIKEKNYDVEFGAVAYIEYKLADGEIVRVYGGFSETDNVRSIKAVAEAALADTKTQTEIDENGGSATFGNWTYANKVGTVEVEGVEVDVYSCYTDEQIAILNTYAGN